MSKKPSTSGKLSPSDFILGAARFAEISAVEGIRLEPAMQKRAASAMNERLSADERRQKIVQSHRKP